jgi:hypothetical protein
VSASGSRPAYVDEFERKLAAALARQVDTKKTRLAPIHSFDSDLSASSSPSLGEALTRSSTSGEAERPLNVAARQPPSETRKGRTPTHEAATVPVRYIDSAIAVGAGTEPLADGSGALGAGQPTGEFSQTTPFESTLELSNVAAPAPPADPATDTSVGDHRSQPARRTEELIEVHAEIVETAVAAELMQAFADAFAQGDSNRPEDGIDAEKAPVSEAARPIEAANLRADETRVNDVTKRGSRGWRFKALAVTVSVAMIGTVLMRVGGMLAPASEASGAAGPNLRENMTPDQGAAEQAPSAEASSPSAVSSAGSDLLKDRPEVNSAAVVATPIAPQAAKTAAVDAIQPAVGLSSETPPASIVSTPGAATPATPALAQSFDVKPVPTVSPRPTSITDPIQSAALPTEGLSEGHAPEPTAEPTRNEHGVGATKSLAPERDAQVKIADKPSTQAVITKNHAAIHRVAVRTPSQPLPHGTSAKHDNSAKEPNAQAAVESAAAAATPAATPQPGGLY